MDYYDELVPFTKEQFDYVWRRYEMEERFKLLEERVKVLEDRLNAMSSPDNEKNLRASMAQAFRDMADELEDEELIPAKRRDPAEPEED